MWELVRDPAFVDSGKSDYDGYHPPSSLWKKRREEESEGRRERRERAYRTIVTSRRTEYHKTMTGIVHSYTRNQASTGPHTIATSFSQISFVRKTRCERQNNACRYHTIVYTTYNRSTQYALLQILCNDTRTNFLYECNICTNRNNALDRRVAVTPTTWISVCTRCAF